VRKRTVALSILLGVSIPLTARGGDAWRREFNREFASRNSWERAAAVALLDPDDPEALRLIVGIAGREDWYLRTAAIGVLASHRDGKNVEALRRLGRSAYGPEAEVALAAMGESHAHVFVDDLTAQLKRAHDERCRRAAAISLGLIPDKKSVAALTEALDKEAKTPLVLGAILESLERLTHEHNRTAEDWKSWWANAEPTWAPLDKS
jgi:HEAT repeat protein